MEQEEILSRLLSDISDEFDKSVGSFFYDIDKPVSEIMALIYKKTEDILKNGFALTAEGKYLDTKVAEQGITRKAAKSSGVEVVITGTPGSSIMAGDKVASDTLTFTVTEDAVSDEKGIISAWVQCDIPGVVGNIPIGAINHFPVTLPGLVSVTNPTPAEGGFDEETDDELRKRYFEKVSLPATSGSKYHYIMWAKEVSGVGDAKCIPLWNGNGTVKVIVIDANKGTANDELISEVREHIEENRPIGAEVTVESAEPKVIEVNVSVVLKDGISEETAKTKVSESITKYLQKNAFANTYISYAQIGGCVLACDEVSDYSNLTLNGGTQNISVSETEVPVLGGVTFA